MARPPAWRYTLDEARRQALVAIDFYNRPGDRRSFSDFIVHIHLAWQNLLHANRIRRKAEIFYRESGGRRLFKRNPDGSKKTWDLTQCLKHEFKDNDPIRANVEFFVGLRNHVEHRFQDSVLVATAAEAHSCIINFEVELIRRFGTPETLGNELKFPVFVQSLSPSRYEEQRDLRRGLPATVSTFITEFQGSLSQEVRSDERFAYRLLLLPMKGPKTEADLALNFVRQEDLSDFVNLIWPRGDGLKWPRRGVGSMCVAVCCQAQQEVGSSLRKRFAVRRMPSAMVRYGAQVSASRVTVNPAVMA